MSAEVSCSVSSAAFRFRGYPSAAAAAGHQLTTSPADMGAVGTKPLNGEPLPAGHTCAARGDEDPASCNCAPCKEKSALCQQKLVAGELEAGQQQQDELRQLHTDWIELRQNLKQLYWLHMDASSAGDGPARQSAAPIQAVMKEKVVRLCQRDPHQLFQRLQGQLQELTLEVKVRLLEHLSRERPGLAQLFLTALLDNYDRLVSAAVSLAPAVHTLEHHHLSRFGLSWESLNKHAYQSVVYMDPMVQNNLPTFISQLRALLSGQQQQRTYADLVRRYLSFDDEMSTVAAQWASAEARVHEFGQEQATLKAKQRMLREDWELLRAQRKLLQQQVLGRDGVTAEEEEEALQRLVAGCSEEGCDECALSLPAAAGAASEVGDVRPRASGLLELRQALESASRAAEAADGAVEPAPPPGACRQPPAGHAHSPHGKSACMKRSAGTQAPPSPAPANSCPSHNHGGTCQNSGTGCQAPKGGCQAAKTNGQAPPSNCQAPAPGCQASAPVCQAQSSACQAPSVGCQAPPGGGCHGQAAGSSHKHTYSKAAPTTHRPQPKFDPALELADDSSQNDSCSEQSSSTTSQHCSCCYCEVFGHGVPPVAPVSRNYPEIRDRLRLRLDQRRRDHKSESSERSGTSTQEDHRDLSDLLEFIEQTGQHQKRNEKRAAKRERQRARRMDEYAAQQQEQEQMRNIQEFQRRNPEVTITVVKSGEDGEKPVSATRSPPPPPPPAAPTPPAPRTPPAAAGPAPSEVGGSPTPPASGASPKKTSPIMEGLARNGLVSVPCAPGAGDSRMVTIRRVMEPGGKEPKVTITLKGDSPEKDRVLMTLVNGQLKNGGAQAPGEPEKMTKTAKKKLKKALREQQRREEEEAAERAREAAARAAEEEEQRLKQLEAAKQKKKNKKKGTNNATTNGTTNQEKITKGLVKQQSKSAGAIVVNGADKWRSPPQQVLKKSPSNAAAALRVTVEPDPPKKAQQPTRITNSKKSKEAPPPAAALASEPTAAARRRPDPRMEPPTQLLQDLALSSSDSEIEDLARAYRIPAGITISRVRGGSGEPAAQVSSTAQPAAAAASQTADKKAKKKKKRKTAAATTAAPEEAVPEVTIRKVAASGQRSMDDYESVFMPAAGGDNITDLVDKEVEAFKRFCLDGPQVSREHRPKVNLNIKDILIKKKPL